MGARGRVERSWKDRQVRPRRSAPQDEFHDIIVNGMKIRSVDAIAISIPLPSPVADAVRLITHRDHLIVTITTESGLSGAGFTLGYDSSVAMIELIERIFSPILSGSSAFDTERLWAEMYRQSIQAGRRGAALRAISAIDIALWDLRGKAANMPVMNLLGVHSQRLRCYATGGYYREGQTVDDLVREAGQVFDKGFTAIKLKVGKLSAAEDAARIGAVRLAYGDSVDILLDANGGWRSSTEAVSAMRRLEEFHPYWIEEPVRADNLSAMRRIAEALDTPVATGELEATRWAFAELMETRAADIVQPDATVCGGVSEWLKIAHHAAAIDIPVAPHYNWDFHTQLCASIPNCVFIEYFIASSGVKMFDSVLADPMKPVDGYIEPRTAPGFGIEFRPEEIEKYRIA
jgi:D-arabinonate dehydratase